MIGRIFPSKYWFMAAPEGWQPPGVLRDFLENGTSPVSVGFGSMTSQDPERITEAVVKALGMSGRRGILLTGWGGISNADLPDDVIKVEEAPHDWLFEMVCAAVHHGVGRGPRRPPCAPASRL
jgi:sterol 3beta-glucosyltransferase